MKKQNLIKDVQQYVEKNIDDFHLQRIKSLDNLKLIAVLQKKNPYLFKAKNVLTAEQYVRNITDAYLSSQEETIFGTWLEGLARFVNHKIYRGIKSSAPGIDLEFNKDGIRYIVSIKSGPNWANGSQKAKMIADFTAAIRTLRTSNSKLHVIAVEGCCYGRTNVQLKKQNYYKYCGQKFWEFISGNLELYTEIIQPLGYQAKERNEDVLQSYSMMINKFTKSFINEFCKHNGEIDWEKIVKLNSAIKKPKLSKVFS